MAKQIGVATAFLSVIFCTLGASAADNAITFMARPTAPIAQGTPGHAFFCISMAVASGIKEDCFGFYPESGKDSFLGAGRISNEFTREAIKNVSVSFRAPLSDDARRRVYLTIAKWAGEDYNLVLNNCGDFLFDVAKAADLTVPNRVSVVLPTQFVEGLKTSNP